MSAWIIHGQKIFDDCYALYVWIDEPFYKAGKIYGWPNPTLGIGLNREILDRALMCERKIRIVLKDYEDRCYQTEPAKWKAFAEKWNSIQYVKISGQTLPELYVMQLSPENFETIGMNVEFLRNTFLS